MKINLVQQRRKENSLVKNEPVNSLEKFSFLTEFSSYSNNTTTKMLGLGLQLTCKITTKGKVRMCNSNFYKALGYIHKEVIKQSFTNTFHPEMPKVILEVVQGELQKGTDSLAIIKQIDKEGNTIWVNSHFSPDTSNRFAIACSVKSNPTSLKAISKIEKIYRTIFLLENHSGYAIAKKYFDGLIEVEYGNYEGFIIDVFQ